MARRKQNLKLYYSTGEVASMFNINESTLRYWEKQFPGVIAPKKNGGVRQYRREDIEQVRLVHNLLKEKGMTIEGAQKSLKLNKEGTVANVDIIRRLESVRDELREMIGELDLLK